MTQLRTSMIIDLAGNLSGRANQFLGSLQRMGSGGSRSMGILQRSVTAATQGLDKLGNRYTAMLSGAVGLGAAKQVADLEERFVRLGIVADADDAAMARLKKQIFEVAKAPEIRVDPGQITGAVEEILEKTGDLKFAEANIRNIGLAIQATGAQGKDIGGIMSEFQKMGLNSKESFEALDILTVQGKAGAFTLKELASLGPRVVTAYTSMGRGGVGAIREMGAALQVIRMGTGSSEMAATAFEAVIRTLGNAKKVEMLKKGGIQVFDVEQLKKGKEVLRPINELMVEIVKKTGGKKTLLSKVFEEEAIRAFNTAASEFQRTGAIESLDKFYNVQADGTVITQDSARAAKTANAAMTNLVTTWKKFADGNLTGPIKSLTATLDGLKPGTVERWLNMAKYAAMVGGGLILARKAFGVYQFGRDIIGGGKGAGGALGGLSNGNPIPVYVVNKQFPNGLPGGIGGGTAAGGAATAGRIGLATGGVIALPFVTAAVARPIGKALAENEASWSSTGRLQDLLSRQLVMGGGPQSFQAKTIVDELTKRGAQDVNGTIKIVIDQDGTARVKSLSSHGSNVQMNVDSGLTMRSH